MFDDNRVLFYIKTPRITEDGRPYVALTIHTATGATVAAASTRHCLCFDFHLNDGMKGVWKMQLQ